MTFLYPPRAFVYLPTCFCIFTHVLLYIYPRAFVYVLGVKKVPLSPSRRGKSTLIKKCLYIIYSVYNVAARAGYISLRRLLLKMPIKKENEKDSQTRLKLKIKAEISFYWQKI